MSTQEKPTMATNGVFQHQAMLALFAFSFGKLLIRAPPPLVLWASSIFSSDFQVPLYLLHIARYDALLSSTLLSPTYLLPMLQLATVIALMVGRTERMELCCQLWLVLWIEYDSRQGQVATEILQGWTRLQSAYHYLESHQIQVQAIFRRVSSSALPASQKKSYEPELGFISCEDFGGWR